MVKKKPTPWDRLMNPGKMERDAWQEDRNKRVELSNNSGMASANRMAITYDDPKFNKKKPSSAKGNTKEWERSELKGLPKSYGTSMDKKFTRWALEQGIPEQDHYQFRQWMDAKEDRVKSSGQSAFDRQTERNVQQASSRRANEQRKLTEIQETEVKAASKAKKKEEGNPVSRLLVKADKKSESNKVFDFLSGIDKKFNEKTKGSKADRAVNRAFNTMGGSSNREVMEQLIKEGPKEGREEQYAEMIQQYEDRFGGKTTALDFGADLAGYLAPGAAAYKGARAVGLGAKGLTSGPSLKNVGQFAKEGAAAGALLGGAEVGIREDLNPENYSASDNLKHLGLNVAAGAALDPLIGLAGPVARTMNPNSMAQKAISDATTAQVDRALRFNSHTTLNPTRPSWGGPMPNSGLTEGAASGQVRFKGIESPLNDALGSPEVPLTSEVVSPLNKLAAGPKVPARLTAQQVAKKPAPDAPFTQKLEYFRDKNNPITEQDLPEIHTRMQEVNSEVQAFEQNLPQLREIEYQKNPKVKAQIEELNTQAKAHVDAMDEWKATQEIQKLYKVKANRPEWMNIGDTLSDDFAGIPKRFRSSGSVTDPYMAMEQAGFNDMEAFIGHLQNIDDQLRVKMKDVQTVSGPDASKAVKKLEKLESELDKHIRKNYGMDEQQKLLDELVEYSRPRQGAASNAEPVTLFRTGREDGNWWSDSQEYTQQGFSSTRGNYEKSFKLKSTLDATEDFSSFTKLLDPETRELMGKGRTSRDPEVRKGYIKALKDNGYDSMRLLDEDDAGNIHQSYFIADTKASVPSASKSKTVKRSALDKTLGVNKKPQPIEPEPLSDDAVEAMMARNKKPKAEKDPTPQGMRVGDTVRDNRAGYGKDTMKVVEILDDNMVLISSGKKLHGPNGLYDAPPYKYPKRFLEADAEVAASTEVLPNSNPLGVVAGRIDDYALSPIANPDITSSGKKQKMGFREAFDSRINPAKKLEKDLSKNLKPELKDAGIEILENKKGKAAKGNAIAFEDSPVKQIQALSRSGSKATRSYEKDMAPIRSLQKKYNIKDVDAEDYIVAKHAEDIFKNEADKVARVGELKTELEKLEANRITNDDPGMRKAIDKREQKVLDELDKLKPYEMPEKVTPEWVKHKLETFGNHAGFQEIQSTYVKNQSKNLSILRESGNISDDAMEAMIKKYPNFVSFARDIPQVKGQKPAKNTVSGRNPLVARKQGSKDLELQSPFVSALKNRNNAVSAADRNKVIHSVRKMAKVKGMDEIFQEVNTKAMGYKAKPDDNLIEGYVDGEKVTYNVPAVLKNAFDNTGSANHEFFGNEMLSGLANVFRKTTTNWNVSFHLWASTRDSMNALANSRTGATIADTTHGFLDSFMGPTLEKVSGGRFKSLREMYLDEGADMGGFVSQEVNSPTNAAKRVQKGKQIKRNAVNPIKWVEGFGMKMEHGPRLGEVRSAKRKGYSDEDAVFEAIDLIDYSDQGAVTRHLNKYDPYLSATIRGNMRTLQAMKNNPKQFMTVGLLNVTVPTVGIWMLQQSDQTNDVQRDKINNMQEYQKNTTWAIPVPGTDEVKFMPKGFILGQLFANPIERTLSKLVTDKSKGLDEIGQDTAKDFAQALIPPTSVIGYETIMELIANKDFFTGIPIESEQDQKKPASQRYTAYNSEVSKAIANNPIGDLLKVSPAKVDHVLKKQTGTLGKQLLNSIDNKLSESGKSPAKTQTTGEILNPLSRFDYKETSSSGLYNRIMKAGEEDAAKKIADTPNGRRPNGFTRTGNEAIMKDFKEIQKEITAITEATGMTPEEKNKEVGRLRRQQRALGSKFLKNN